METLTKLRQERGWSQQKLADASGVDKATINQAERGRRSPKVETLEKLADALGVEIADFFPKFQAELPFDAQAKAWRAVHEGRGELAAWGVESTWQEGAGGVALGPIGPPELYAVLQEVERGEKTARQALRELEPLLEAAS